MTINDPGPPGRLSRLAPLALMLLLACCVRSPGSGQDAPGGPVDASTFPPEQRGTTVRVVTWNVWRLFDSTCDSGQCEDWQFEALPSAEEVDERLDELASVIRRMRPDVALLQEIETDGLLARLAGRLSDVLPHRGFGETGRAASVDVGVLSAYPIVQTLGHSGDALRRDNGDRTWFSRELLEAQIDVDGHQLAAFTAHFRSKVEDDPERRLLEGRATAAVLRASASSLPDALVVLGGDLNDTPGSPPLDALESLGGLQRVAAELTDDADATYIYQGQSLAIDHIYMAPTAGARYVPGSAQVFRDTGASDHAALSADFEFR